MSESQKLRGEKVGLKLASTGATDEVLKPSRSPSAPSLSCRVEKTAWPMGLCLLYLATWCHVLFLGVLQTIRFDGVTRRRMYLLYGSLLELS